MSTNGNRAYTMLFITDYSKAKSSWKRYVDSVINNLLDKPASKGWDKFENLPPITVSIIDIAETRQQAFEMLKDGKYDVVFIDNRVNGQNNGAGIINRFRQYQESSMYIPLYAPSQVPGAVKSDGTISEGLGLRNLYDKGFYNGVQKQNLDLALLIDLIQKGGRSKEEAYKEYNLGYGVAQIADIDTEDNSTVPVASSEKNSNNNSENLSDANSSREENHLDINFIVKVAQLYPSFSLNQVKGFIEAAGANYSKLQLVSSLLSAQHDLSNPEKWIHDMLVGNDNSSNDPTADKADRTETVNNDDGVRLNRKQRRALKKEQENNSFKESVPNQNNDISNDAIADTHSSAPIPVPPVCQKEEPLNMNMKAGMRELESLPDPNALQVRGSYNNGMVQTGIIHGNVVFVKGNIALVELGMDIKAANLSLADVYNAPVTIPYTKFKEE